MKFRPGAQRVRNRLGIVVTVSAAVSCAPVPDQERTVAYYREHAAEREAQLRKCVDNAGAIGDRADCVNAKQAARVEGIGSQRELPPLDLSGDGKPSNGS